MLSIIYVQIYLYLQEKFRKEFADRLPCLRCLKAKPKGDRTEQSDMMPNSVRKNQRKI